MSNSRTTSNGDGPANTGKDAFAWNRRGDPWNDATFWPLLPPLPRPVR